MVRTTPTQESELSTRLYGRKVEESVQFWNAERMSSFHVSDLLIKLASSSSYDAIYTILTGLKLSSRLKNNPTKKNNKLLQQYFFGEISLSYSLS